MNYIVKQSNKKKEVKNGYLLQEVQTRTYFQGRQARPCQRQMVSTDCLYLHYHLDEIATKVAYDCTVTKADCTVVIEALIHEMNNQLLNSYSVKLDGSGLSKLPSNQGGYRGIRVLSAINIYGWGLSRSCLPTVLMPLACQRQSVSSAR